MANDTVLSNQLTMFFSEDFCNDTVGEKEIPLRNFRFEQLSLNDINQLDQLHLFIKEVLRIYPVVALLPNRVAQSKVQIGEYQISKGVFANYFTQLVNEQIQSDTKFSEINYKKWQQEDQTGKQTLNQVKSFTFSSEIALERIWL
ncbi:Cytochrome P450 [Pseudocohnilembus persalinus]|uniref:Cytochrome P450 n=1 Tax=Pseudocohnilembus persalinus TaxID=266149 RepID=A0A0V0Q855_PSEPJ|nr:Cytochrome P450 [Pseudocohnilembus persalinus]|eukprot:KRW98231.1 Cytochrome P450 [Pseudocohnilembus persalinus]